MHLRMTGTLLLDPVGCPAYTRVVVRFGRRRRLHFVDPRRFGTGEVVVGDDALETFFAERLGVEPFDEAFTGEALRARARGRRRDQDVPARPAQRRRRRQHLRRRGAVPRPRPPAEGGGQPPAGRYGLLRDAVRDALSAGIDARGASIDDFRDLDGARGSFQDRFLVHLRAGQPCLTCGTQIRKITVGGRGTYFCPHCQPQPRRVRA